MYNSKTFADLKMCDVKYMYWNEITDTMQFRERYYETNCSVLNQALKSKYNCSRYGKWICLRGKINGRKDKIATYVITDY